MSSDERNPRNHGDDTQLRLAVLIDADNAQAKVIEGLLAEVARLGEATVRRIYGDFTSSANSSWKNVLQRHAIKPVQQFAYSTGKNSTDSTLIIDAMDLLYTRNFDGFCLVTSDSDFTGLALRLREEGLRVFGFGEQKTPEAFRNACHRFVFIEVLRPGKGEQSKAKTQPQPAKKAVTAQQPKTAAKQQGPTKSSDHAFPTEFMLDALEESADDSGWANLGTFGSYLTKLQPDFDSRLYGYRKLSDLVRAKPELFRTEERPTPGSSQRSLWLRAASDPA